VSEILNRLMDEIEIVDRHLRLLTLVREKGPIGIIKLSEITGWPHHKIRYSLRVLEEEGLIKPSKEGAITTPKTEDFINRLRNILEEMLKKLEGIYDDMPR